MLCDLHYLLARAQSNSYAVGAFNVNSFEYASAFVKAAEETNSPLILQFSPGVVRTYKDSSLVRSCAMTAELSKVPVCIHLDHAKTIEDIQLGIQHGVFLSYMIDGSQYSLQENIQLTNEANDLLHRELTPHHINHDRITTLSPYKGYSLEAEIGHVGTCHSDKSSDTSLEEVLQFVSSVEIDALAIAIGNTHGEKNRDTNLNIPLLKTIRQNVSTPLVLHGASGVKPEMIKETIKNGITKVNVNTYFKETFSDSIVSGYEKHGKEFFTNYRLHHPTIHSALVEKAKEILTLLGSASAAAALIHEIEQDDIT
jgi:fructose/tagatose bisphosphate aldolase